MEVHSVQRPAGAFQEPLSAPEIEAILRRCFGPAVRPRSASELSGGAYNTTYQIVLDDSDPVILRVAPAPGRQFRLERELLRNEHAALGFLAPIAHLLPRTIAADFTHDLVGRDYLVQSVLPGRWAAGEFRSLPESAQQRLLEEIGRLTAAVHAVRGSAFGRVAGPVYPRWSTAMLAAFDAILADLAEVGLAADDLQALTERIDAGVLDEITEPRLLHGDLWLVNVMTDEQGQVTGVFDHDRAFWGDPAADWTWYMLRHRPWGEQDAVCRGYGGRPADSAATDYRDLVYLARSIGESRLEHHRLGHADGVAGTYPALAEVRAALGLGMTGARVHREVVSFVRRSARMNPSQIRAYAEHADRLLILVPRGQVSTSVADDAEPLDLEACFGRRAPLVVEIGPGTGDSLVPMAARRPELDVLAFEVFEPAIASLLGNLGRAGVDNVRVLLADAVPGLTRLLGRDSVAEVWMFFPDPWHKARHHKRRLLSTEFADLVADRMLPGGHWRLATDWGDYAMHMREILDAHPAFASTSPGGWAPRLLDRPVTRFERRGVDAGRRVFDLDYVRVDR